MQSVLICPSERDRVAALTEAMPLSNVPMFGKTLVEYWLERVALLGAREVLILTADRPEQVRALVGSGARWGLKVVVQPEHCEMSPDEARVRYCDRPSDWLPSPHDAVVMDHLPGLPEVPLVTSYADWFAAVRAWLPHAATLDRIGVREIKPGVWVGLHTRIAPNAELHAPCWIGENVRIDSGVVIGPNAVIESDSFVSQRAEISDSIVGPETFVGEFTGIQSSIALGNTLVNWERESCLIVPDPYLLCSLEAPNPSAALAGTIARISTALAALLPTAHAPESYGPPLPLQSTLAKNRRST